MTHHPTSPILSYHAQRLVSVDLPALELPSSSLIAAAHAALVLCSGLAPETYLPLRAGTSFQRAVWEALLRVPPGETRTYAQLAGEIGAPRSARAVANACAANRLAVVVPCHRVIPSGGGTGGYRWGPHWKSALLAAEEQALAAPAVVRYL